MHANSGMRLVKTFNIYRSKLNDSKNGCLILVPPRTLHFVLVAPYSSQISWWKYDFPLAVFPSINGEYKRSDYEKCNKVQFDPSNASPNWLTVLCARRLFSGASAHLPAFVPLHIILFSADKTCLPMNNYLSKCTINANSFTKRRLSTEIQTRTSVCVESIEECIKCRNHFLRFQYRSNRGRTEGKKCVNRKLKRTEKQHFIFVLLTIASAKVGDKFKNSIRRIRWKCLNVCVPSEVLCVFRIFKCLAAVHKQIILLFNGAKAMPFCTRPFCDWLGCLPLSPMRIDDAQNVIWVGEHDGANLSVH